MTKILFAKIGSFLLDKLFSPEVSTPFLLFRIYFVDGSENIEAAVDSCRNRRDTAKIGLSFLISQAFRSYDNQ